MQKSLEEEASLEIFESSDMRLPWTKEWFYPRGLKGRCVKERGTLLTTEHRFGVLCSPMGGHVLQRSFVSSSSLGVGLDSSKPILLIAFPLPVIALRTGRWLYSGQ